SPRGQFIMSSRRHLLLYVVAVSLGVHASLMDSVRGEERTAPEHRTPRSKADRPPRKVLVGTVIFGPYGKYPGLDERLKVLSGLVDAMAAEAARVYPGRGLDLAVLPETTVTSTHGTASERAIPLRGLVLDTFGALARRHKTYLVVPL